MPTARRVPFRVLRLGAPGGVGASAAPGNADGTDSRGVRVLASHLWVSTGARGTGARWRAGGRRAGATPDARGRPASGAGQAPAGADRGRPRCGHDPGSDRAELHRASAGGEDGRRYHADQHRRRLTVPRDSDRLFFEKHSWMGCGQELRHRSGIRGDGNGRRPYPIARGGDIPLRPRQSRRIQLVVATPRSWRC